MKKGRQDKVLCHPFLHFVKNLYQSPCRVFSDLLNQPAVEAPAYILATPLSLAACATAAATAFPTRGSKAFGIM